MPARLVRRAFQGPPHTEGADPAYIYASIKADPKMIVHWAMQYSGLVEVMDEEVRALIKEELERMREKYE